MWRGRQHVASLQRGDEACGSTAPNQRLMGCRVVDSELRRSVLSRGGRLAWKRLEREAITASQRPGIHLTPDTFPNDSNHVCSNAPRETGFIVTGGGVGEWIGIDSPDFLANAKQIPIAGHIKARRLAQIRACG